jgi:hypothetical protein
MKRQRYIAASRRGLFFPPVGRPFELAIGNERVVMNINVWGRMKPVHAIWSHIKGLASLEVGDVLVFTRQPNGTYHMKRERPQTTK